MGHHLNPGHDAYCRAVKADVFVDKTAMLRHLNAVAATTSGCVCLTRPHGFGKTMAADMVSAYFGLGADGRALFEGLEISRTKPVSAGHGSWRYERAWDHYLGAFDVVRTPVSDNIDAETGVEEGMNLMERAVCREIIEACPNADYFDGRTCAVCCRTRTSTTSGPS